MLKIAENKNLKIDGPDSVQAYFPSWKGIRVQYRRLLNQAEQSPKAKKEKRRIKEPENFDDIETRALPINIDNLDEVL